MQLLVEQMKVGAEITEELKVTDQMKWVGLINKCEEFDRGNRMKRADICVVWVRSEVLRITNFDAEYRLL